MRYDLTDLRLFRAVVAEGSITAGAARVHLSLAVVRRAVPALLAPLVVGAGLAAVRGGAAERAAGLIVLVAVLVAGAGAVVAGVREQVRDTRARRTAAGDYSP